MIAQLAQVVAVACIAAATAQVPDPPEPVSDIDGVVLAAYDAPLAFGVGGTVATLPVQLGDRVTKGQVLATLDDRVAQAEASVARAAAESDAEARAADARVEALRAARAAATEVRAAEAEAAAARARQERAKRELALATARVGSHRLIAPVDGVVERVDASVGGYVAAGFPVLRLVQANPVAIEASVPSDRGGDIARGRAAAVVATAPDGTTRTIPAEWAFVSTTMDPETDARTARARLLVDDANLLVGSHVGIDLDPASASGDTSPPPPRNPDRDVSAAAPQP